jgi:hypothetical protein
LMTHHYDPRYRRHRDQSGAPIARIELAAMDDASLAEAADRLCDIIAKISQR